MPRIARVVVTGYPHHVTQRGNYKQATFTEDSDYVRYLGWLSEYAKKYALSVLSYSLMPNHVHFIAVPKKEDSLAKTFNACHMRYSQYFNRKNDQRGHLWQGRFYSCVLDERHLYAAIKYVEKNPVRAKLAIKPEDWRWSSAGYHLGIEKDNTILSGVEIEDYVSIHNWQEYLAEDNEEEMIKEIRANTLTGRPSGGDAFIQEMESMFKKRLRPLPVGRPKKG